MATITITVTVSNPGSGNKYYLDGVLQATYAATPGNTYKFDQADGSNSGHPLRLSITSNGSHGGGSAYTTGVTTSGTPGSAGAYTQIEVTATTVQALYYYCTAHSGMGGSFNTGSSATVQFQDRKGFDIQNFSADQTSVGQIYYNTSSGSFKAVKDGGAPIGAWASGGNLNTYRGSAAGFGASLSSALTAGGASNSPSTPATVNTETYNGTSWTEVNNLNAGKQYSGSFGIITAGVFAGGGTSTGAFTNQVETWDGTNWTEANEINTTRSYLMGAGTSTAGMIIGGYYTPPATRYANVELWNGSSWTETTDLNVARAQAGSSINAAQTSVVVFGGEIPPGATGTTESWNGSSWTEVADMNTARKGVGGAGESNTNALIFGGNPPHKANTEAWNGSAWTEVNDLSLARSHISSNGTNTNALATGGEYSNPPTGGYSNSTEEWSAAAFEVKTLTTS